MVQFSDQVAAFIKEWEMPSPTLYVKTSGSTGVPKQIAVEKKRMIASAQQTCDFLELKSGDSALLCMPIDYIAGKMMVVRALIRNLQLIMVEPNGHPYAHLAEAPTFAAMVPSQVYNSLLVEKEYELLRQTKHLIIGGGAISAEIAYLLKDFPNAVWSTYGMTETLSHIALRRLNGPSASEWYTPFPSVHLELGENGCLVIDAPDVCEETLFTHDCAVLREDGSFRILGRKDNILCSGGIKIRIEDIEQELAAYIDIPFQITAVEDIKFGDGITLLYQSKTDQTASLYALCTSILPRYWIPKHYVRVLHLPFTQTGKPARKEARCLAQRSIQKISNERD